MWRRVQPVRCVPAPRQLAADFSRHQATQARPRLTRGEEGGSHHQGLHPMPMGMLCRVRLAVAETKNHPKVASDIHNIASVGLEAPTRPIY